MMLVIQNSQCKQACILDKTYPVLWVVLAGFALGGAERIVLEWIQRIEKRFQIHLCLLRDHKNEWPIPSHVVVTRLQGENLEEKLRVIGRNIAKSGNGTCLAHLLTNSEINALRSGGTFTIPVFHNAKNGWRDTVNDANKASPALSVSYACRSELRREGWVGDISVLHHIPTPRTASVLIREEARKKWHIPQNAFVIGMIGAFKPQKDYPHALRILKQLHERGMRAYLVVLGGPTGRNGIQTWREAVATLTELGMRNYVSFPGFVGDAAKFLPVFDLFLNTSNYEGLSIATLEALAHGLNVVASRVGGQGEVEHSGLWLLEKQASESDWVEAIIRMRAKTSEKPRWATFPSYRLWTLAHLVRPYDLSDKVLFVTANLNSGGAQRSLVNLLTSFSQKASFSLAVAGNSTTDFFLSRLIENGRDVFRTTDSRNVFDHAEILTEYCVQHRIGVLCFWNVDPKLKLLLAKVLGFTSVRFVDVSPGNYAFEELENIREFGVRVCFSSDDYYERLSSLVLKYEGNVPGGYFGKTTVIKNGVMRAPRTKKDYNLGEPPRVVVVGRIAPSKFLREIVEAIQLVRKVFTNTELHIYGGVEPRHEEYAKKLTECAQSAQKVYFHGPAFDSQSFFRAYDVCVVLGRHQGCPNTILEALSVGLPVIANDDGGTREQILHKKTGWLIESTSPQDISEAILSLFESTVFRKTFGENGRRHTETMFSMENMVLAYKSLLWKDSHVGCGQKTAA